ncbi:MAG: hypothetical protein ACYTFO_10340, partial [Planctomycetota bacterium]
MNPRNYATWTLLAGIIVAMAVTFAPADPEVEADMPADSEEYVIRLYRISDLLKVHEDHPFSSADWPQPLLCEPGELDHEPHPDDDIECFMPQEWIETIIEGLQEMVDTYSWDDEAFIREFRGVLYIRQTLEAHEEIETYFAELRSIYLAPPLMTIQALW